MEQNLENLSTATPNTSDEGAKGSEISQAETKVKPLFAFRPIYTITFCADCGRKATFIGENFHDKWKKHLCYDCVNKYLSLNSS